MSGDVPTARVARLTPRGRGAVATLRLIGAPDLLDDGAPALFRAANGRNVADQPIGRISFGWFGGAAPEEIVVCRVDRFTVELHCHGGDAAAERIVGELMERGVLLESGFNQRIAAAGLLERECHESLAGAATLRTANIAHAQISGVLRSAIENAIAALPDLERAGGILEQIWQWRDVGRRLGIPWRVVVVGRPNVGKSRLMNALLGYDRSIVFDAPGTTRDVLTGETAFEGWPVQLTDTAGMRESAGPIETEGIRRARSCLSTADLILVVLDRSQPLTSADRDLVSEFAGALVLANKCDLPDAWEGDDSRSSLRISAATGAGLRQLQSEIVHRLVPKAPEANHAVPVCDRQRECLNRAILGVSQGNPTRVRNELLDLLG